MAPVYGLESTLLITGPQLHAQLSSVSSTGLSSTASGMLYDSRSMLDASFANGTFRFQITYPASALFDGSISLTGNTYPPVAEITNYNNLQQVSGGLAAVQWNLPGGRASDFVIASITDLDGEVLSSTDDLDESRPLDGTSRSASLLVPPGMDLIGNLMAVRLAGTARVADVDLLAGYATVTAFPIKTSGTRDTLAPRITSVTPAAGAFGVDENATVELTFDKPMRLRGDVSSASLPSGFPRSINSWTADQRTVHIHWPRAFPSGPITLRANAEQGPLAAVPFADLSGNQLAATEAASFFVGNLPAFVSQPADATLRPGQAFSLAPDVQWPGASLTLQWYRDGAPIPGATTANFMANAFSAQDVGVYELRATNEFGEARSQAALVLPDLTYALRNLVSIGVGSMTRTERVLVPPGGQIDVRSSFLPPSPVALQWRRNGLPLAGATDATLLIAPVAWDDAGVYDLLVTNAYGSIASQAMELVVSTDIALPDIAPEMDTFVFDVGDKRVLSGVNMDNSTLLRFWRLNGVPIPNATAWLYEIASFSPASAGLYEYVVSNGEEEKVLTQISVALRTGAPVVQKPLLSASGAGFFSEDAGFMFTISAEGAAPLHYQWQRDGVDLPGATGNLYNRWPADPAEAGTYRCVVSNSLGTVVSTEVAVRFWSKQVPPSTPVITGNKAALAGSTPMLSVSIPRGPQPAGTIQWYREGVPIAYATMSYLQIIAAKVGDSGNYTVAATNAYGTSYSDPFALSVIDDSMAPVVAGGPVSLSLAAGEALSLAAPVVAGPSATYQWFLNDRPVTSAIKMFNQSPAIFLAPSAQTRDAGVYTVHVSNSAGSIDAQVAAVAVAAPPALSSTHLTNLSTRGMAGVGNQTLIAGFTVEGVGRKRVLIRGVGSGLASWVEHPARGARITLFHGDRPLQTSADWFRQPAAAQTALEAQLLGAFSLLPRGDDAATIVEVDPGAYTVQLQADSAANGATGIALVEVYDADAGMATTRLTNLSTRAFIGPDERVAIPGLVITGASAKTYLIRAVGPTLATYGVEELLADPQLTLQEANLGRFMSNDDWGDNRDATDVAAVAERVGAFALDAGSKDAALLATLKPGAYTILASGAGETSGVVLLEIYEVPQNALPP
ncbi:Ig-like domain-containing protein [Horticoccus luteus]|uniref:Ig-like domain-containing protein n=1 Tax=Horticoccus luteus TaxID=2862869 RepID=A0A8F9TWG4_9BACT|nr:Ig-like domain-containing protein [Horticoccus luteus]QYM79023.1 Ig-like domain-containing protein [Horticoccus luteus]